MSTTNIALTDVATFAFALPGLANPVVVEAEFLPREPDAGLPSDSALVMGVNGMELDFYGLADVGPALAAVGLPPSVTLEDLTAAWLDARYAATAGVRV